MNTPSSPTPRVVSAPRRRLRITFCILGLFVLLLLTGTGIWAYRSRPVEYRPDEQNSEITSNLSADIPAHAPKPLFNDVTSSAGLASFRAYIGERTSQLPEDMGSGLAWGDFDNDQDEDLLLVSAGGSLRLPEEQLAPSELYENLGNGSFRKVSSFPVLKIRGMGAAWGDYDHDGFLDLAISGYNKLVLLHNENGNGQFTAEKSFAEQAGFWAGVSWSDFDRDGLLDLYVCGYVQFLPDENASAKVSEQLGTAVPYTLNPASYKAGLNMLLKNLGQRQFKDVAPEMGVSNPDGRSLSALWHDFDDDGWADLYVANDISDNVLYRNVAGKFQDISHPAYVADYRSAMGLAAGDFDRDGDDDLFVTHWVAQENALYENQWANFNAASTNKPANKPFALRFMDIADLKGLGQMSLPFVGWGTEFVDLDSDGWLDLLVANGNTLEEPGSVPRKLKRQEAFFLWNDRATRYYNVGSASRTLSEPHNTRGLACADFDRDGDLDFAMTQLDGGVQLIRNDIPQGNWVQLRLRHKNLNGSLGFADGARVIARAGEITFRRTVSTASYLSQSSRLVHIGLGPATKLDRVEVRWPDGQTQVFEGLAAKNSWVLTQGEPLPVSQSPAQNVAAIVGAENKPGSSDKKNVLLFWDKQRAAMNAMKLETNYSKAILFFREALQLNPDHEDSRYYLATCLAATGEAAGALRELEELGRLSPSSHRAFKQLGRLRAAFAKTPDDLALAEQAVLKAYSLNPEETGALLLAGEISLLRGDHQLAAERLAAACKTNPRATGGFFLQAYIAWAKGEHARATELLKQARETLGPDWQPKGTTAEGDTLRKQHTEKSPLTPFWETWDGKAEPDRAFVSLKRRLSSGTSL